MFDVGTIVLWNQRDLGIVIEVPPPDDYWGVTAVIRWLHNGYEEEMTLPSRRLEIICD